MTKTNKKAISRAIANSTSTKRNRRVESNRDRQREEDIRISFHNGMIAGLAQVKREIKDEQTAKAVERIQNRVITHRDKRDHHSSRWYVGSCRDALRRSVKQLGD